MKTIIAIFILIYVPLLFCTLPILKDKEMGIEHWLLGTAFFVGLIELFLLAAGWLLGIVHFAY